MRTTRTRHPGRASVAWRCQGAPGRTFPKRSTAAEREGARRVSGASPAHPSVSRKRGFGPERPRRGAAMRSPVDAIRSGPTDVPSGAHASVASCVVVALRGMELSSAPLPLCDFSHVGRGLPLDAPPAGGRIGCRERLAGPETTRTGWCPERQRMWRRLRTQLLPVSGMPDLPALFATRGWSGGGSDDTRDSIGTGRSTQREDGGPFACAPHYRTASAGERNGPCVKRDLGKLSAQRSRWSGGLTAPVTFGVERDGARTLKYRNSISLRKGASRSINRRHLHGAIFETTSRELGS